METPPPATGNAPDTLHQHEDGRLSLHSDSHELLCTYELMSALVTRHNQILLERNEFRNALKQIKANPGWQDNEVGFMSGHIAHGVLTQFPEEK